MYLTFQLWSHRGRIQTDLSSDQLNHTAPNQQNGGNVSNRVSSAEKLSWAGTELKKKTTLISCSKKKAVPNEEKLRTGPR